MALEEKNEMQVRLVPRLLFSAQLFPLKSTMTSHTKIVRYQINIGGARFGEDVYSSKVINK